MQKATLLFSCPDQTGIVAMITEFFRDHKLNIINLEQHSENNMFFMRIEWEDQDPWENKSEFSKKFQEISKKLQGNFSVHFFKEIQHLGLFVSGEIHALLEILNKIELEELPKVEVDFLISNNQKTKKIADRYNIPFYFISALKNSGDYEKKQLEIIKKYKPDVIGLARYMKILSAEFIAQADCKIVNIHHSFLPSFVGSKPYEMAYKRGVKLMGATSHFVIPALDQGPIIEQDVCRIRSGYSIEDLKRIGRDVEKRVFAKALQKVLEHKVITYKGRTIIFE